MTPIVLPDNAVPAAGEECGRVIDLELETALASAAATLVRPVRSLALRSLRDFLA